MDDRHFDVWVRTVAERGTRRGLLGCLSTLPLVGGLAALLGEENVAAKSRRTKAHHERQLSAAKKRKKKKRKKKCKPQSRETTCVGKCGRVTNNCKQSVDCGACACDPLCPPCQICNATTVLCEPDPDQQGEGCDAPGHVCLGGTCQSCGLDGEPCCAGSSCQPDDGLVCHAGSCESCGSPGQRCCDGATCPFHADAVCVGDTCEFCGFTGEPCCADDFCGGGRVCLAGTCEECGHLGGPCCDDDVCVEGTCSAGVCLE